MRRRPTRPPGQAISKSDATSGRGKQIAVQKRRVRLAGRTPVHALERAVVEHAVDPPHLLVEDGVERAALGQDLAHDAVAVLVRPALPRVVRLREIDLDPERLLELLEEGERLAVVERAGLQHVLRDPVSPAASDDHLERPALPELRLEDLPHLVRELPPLCGLHGDAVLGHALGLLVPVSFLALVPIQLARDGRNRF